MGLKAGKWVVLCLPVVVGSFNLIVAELLALVNPSPVNLDLVLFVLILLKTGDTGTVSGFLGIRGTPRSPALVNTLGFKGLALKHGNLTRYDRRNSRSRANGTVLGRRRRTGLVGGDKEAVRLGSWY